MYNFPRNSNLLSEFRSESKHCLKMAENRIKGCKTLLVFFVLVSIYTIFRQCFDSDLNSDERFEFLGNFTWDILY